MDEETNAKIRELRHKLINSMTVILGHTQILLDGLAGELNDEQKNRVLKVKETSEKLTAFIRDCLADNP